MLKIYIKKGLSKLDNYLCNKLKSIAHHFIFRESSETIKKYVDLPLAHFFHAVAEKELSLKRMLTKATLSRYMLVAQIFFIFLLFCGYRVGQTHSDNVISQLSSTKTSLTYQLNDSKAENVVLKEQLHKAETELELYKNTAEYKRYIIFKESHINVPLVVSKHDLTYMMAMAEKYTIPYHIFFRIGNMESGFKKNIVSKKGARSYFQVMPGTKALFMKMISNPNGTDAEVNIEVAARMLRYGYDTYYNGNELQTWKKVIAMYMAGEGNMYSIMNSDDYKNYVAYVLKGYKKK